MITLPANFTDVFDRMKEQGLKPSFLDWSESDFFKYLNLFRAYAHVEFSQDHCAREGQRFFVSGKFPIDGRLITLTTRRQKGSPKGIDFIALLFHQKAVASTTL